MLTPKNSLPEPLRISVRSIPERFEYGYRFTNKPEC